MRRRRVPRSPRLDLWSRVGKRAPRLAKHVPSLPSARRSTRRLPQRACSLCGASREIGTRDRDSSRAALYPTTGGGWLVGSVRRVPRRRHERSVRMHRPVEVPLKLCDEKRGKRNRANSRRGLRWAQHDDPAAQFLLLLLDPQASVERIDVPSFEPEQLTLSQPHEPREQDEAPVALGDRCRDFPHSHDWPAERARRSTSAASPRRFCSKCGRDWSTFDQCLPNFGGADRSPCKNGHSHTRTISRDGRRAAPDTLRA